MMDIADKLEIAACQKSFFFRERLCAIKSYFQAALFGGGRLQ